MSDHEHRLSHVDESGAARMVDVGAKPVTRRTATAGGRLETTTEVIALVRGGEVPKGDVLATARLAGIQAAKRTDELIPLAHSLPIDHADVSFELHESAIEIRATASVTGRTGVEMEALTAVAVAGLTLHDMIKAVDPRATLGEIRLLEKSGGTKGHWTRASRPAPPQVEPVETAPARVEPVDTRPAPPRVEPVETRPAIVLVSSTRAAYGAREDTTGPVIDAWLRDRGFSPTVEVIPDNKIGAALGRAVAAKPSVVITTGGTGVSPTDETPEATRAVIERELPGVAEAIRAAGRAATPTAALSRALVGVSGETVVINLPGSPGGARDGLAVLDGLLPHLLDQLSGRDHG